MGLIRLCGYERQVFACPGPYIILFDLNNDVSLLFGFNFFTKCLHNLVHVVVFLTLKVPFKEIPLDLLSAEIF